MRTTGMGTSGMDTIERRAAGAWIAGAGLWAVAAAIEVVGVPDGAAFVAFELVWALAQLFLLVGLVALARSRPWADRRAGRVGLAIAVVGRLVFLAAELDCIRLGTNDSNLLPVGMVLTLVGMTTLGVAVVRQRCWVGWHRWAPLAMGVYPLVAMLPLVAITGEPPTVTIGLWAATFAALGVAQGREAAPAPAVAPGRRALAHQRTV